MSEPSAITGLPDPHVAIHAVGHAGDAAFDLEAVLLENAGQVLRRLELLEAELAEAEDLIDHLLRHHVHRVDVGGGLAFQIFDALRSGRCGRRRRRGRAAASALRADGAREQQREADRQNGNR